MLRSRSLNGHVRRLYLPQIYRASESNEFITHSSEEVIKHGVEGTHRSKDNGTNVWPRDLRILAVKDNIVTSNQPTTCASGILKEHRSPFQATVVERLHSSGATVVGKTNMDEFGMGSHSLNSYFGPVYDVSPSGNHSVGGSSGGSAVAVAKGKAHFALGTDTGGSVRLPAAYTGIVGFKPSYGLISRWGVVPYANSLDTVGIMAPNANGLGQIIARLRSYDPHDPTSLTSAAWDLKKEAVKDTGDSAIRPNSLINFKVGVPVEYNIEELHPAIRRIWIEALACLRRRGAIIVPVSLPNTKHALSAYYILAPAEAASNLSKYDGVRYGSRTSDSDGSGAFLYSDTRGAGFGDEVKRRILLGTYTLSSTAIDNYFIKAQKIRRLVQQDFDRIFVKPNPLRPLQQFDLSDMDESILLESKLGPSQVDVIVCPTAPTFPPTIEEVSAQSKIDTYMNDVFTVPASLAGLPAITVPFSAAEVDRHQGQPHQAGIQIIGQYADDLRVVELAKSLGRWQLQDMEQPEERPASRPAYQSAERQSAKIRKENLLREQGFISYQISEKAGHSRGSFRKMPPIRKHFDETSIRVEWGVPPLTKQFAKKLQPGAESVPPTRKHFARTLPGSRYGDVDVAPPSEDSSLLAKKNVARKVPTNLEIENSPRTRKGQKSRPYPRPKDPAQQFEEVLATWSSSINEGPSSHSEEAKPRPGVVKPKPASLNQWWQPLSDSTVTVDRSTGTATSIWPIFSSQASRQAKEGQSRLSIVRNEIEPKLRDGVQRQSIAEAFKAWSLGTKKWFNFGPKGD